MASFSSEWIFADLRVFKVDIIEAVHSESVLLLDSLNWIMFLLRLVLLVC
ncbi:hypothetical protein CGH38_10635 [Vibrio parahaemolyticus]|nr:hypothetical protein CGH38_10635 [Vibrio parahaemolyticus]